jgi:uncharacterized repeat protein (TIGR03803 family)
VVFQITPAGTYTILHTFAINDGPFPKAGVIQATDGSFYGTTFGGGVSNGTIFRLSTGLGPFVKTLPLAGAVGRGVLVYGHELTGATSVTFNGVASDFFVASDTLISATVPPGAGTGLIQVTTPSTILTSNVAFQVIP